MSNLYRRLPLLLAALTVVILVLSCEPSGPKSNLPIIVRDTVLVPAHECLELKIPLTEAMVSIPELPAELYVYFEVRTPTWDDTLSDYMMTFDNWLAFDQNLPFTSLAAHHGAHHGDYQITDMSTPGDYSFVLDNRADSMAKTVYRDIHWIYWTKD